MSHTYRRSLLQSSELLEVDPKNIYLARQSRIRVDAELVRDMLLCASGKLSRKVGGPSVFPWQPDGVFEFGQVKKSWPLSQGEDAYRRSLYTFFYRGAPYPLFTTFDTPDFVKTCTHRVRTVTPLQSLTLANDPSILKLAGFIGDRAFIGKENFHARMNTLSLLTLSRTPREEEVTLMKHYHSQWQGSQKDFWKAAARVMINTNEFVFRG